MRESIMTGKTVEEATQLALAELGIEEEEATVEVLELPQKKLFRTIPAKVRVWVDEPEQAPETPEARPQAAPVPAPRPEKKPAPAPQPAKKPQAAPRVKGEPQAEQAPQAVPDVQQAPAQPIAIEGNVRLEAACEYIRAVAKAMHAEAISFSAEKAGETTILKVNGDDAGALIGHRGEVMEAMSYLCGLVANRADGEYEKMSLDVNGYRSKREQNLIALAKRIGAKVARTGRSQMLEPMNPYERRIIHSTISQMENVKSESTGEGAARRVVISCTGENARPQRGRKEGRGTRRGGRGGKPRRDGERRDRRPSVPAREYADTPRDAHAAPMAPRRTETINDGADLPLFGKIEL